MDTAIAGMPRRIWAQDSFVHSVRVFISLGGATAVCWRLDQMEMLVPLLLGSIASALAETDDNWRGRVRALLVTLVCFAVAAFSVQALIGRPWLFVAGLALSTFGLTMLGAISDRYRAIAWATVILAIYTMLNVGPHAAAAGPFWEVPALLLVGALWHGVLSVLWCALFPYPPVLRNLAELYEALGSYLRLKASLFEPVRGVDVERRRLALAQVNARVVGAMNKAKESLFNRLDGQPRPSARLSQLLHLYFIAQDIHERASSSHYHYNELADRFFHSDVLYRCQRVLSLLGLACDALAQELQAGRTFTRD
ncbi:MAG TPA: FUSC family membrane protein, partial [Burkholderiaceae bacterium]